MTHYIEHDLIDDMGGILVREIEEYLANWARFTELYGA